MTNRSDLETLLPAVVAAVRAAGQRLRDRFTADARPDTAIALLDAISANDAAATPTLRDALLAARPGSGWIEDEEEAGPLPDGEWWVADPAEGNVNHIHGRVGWAVTATLVRDGLPVLTVAVLPLADETYSAILGGGALLNGQPIRVSRKIELQAAIVGTGQARAGEDASTQARIGRSVTAMLGRALLVRMSVPATLELVDVATGRSDAFWQHSQVRSGLACGALLVAEAGGTVTDLQGRPWSFASEDFLAAAPGIHADSVATLSDEAAI
jgi:myo-inositol-1(or 4)-monophosphatase